MDSLDFFRRCIWPINDRDETDARLDAVLAWIGENALPERVFSLAQLDAWAHAHGYATRGDLAQISALLRRVAPMIPAFTPLSREVNDAIAAYRER